MIADAEISLEDQEETQIQPCQYVKVSLLGLTVHVVSDRIFGLAFLHPSAKQTKP